MRKQGRISRDLNLRRRVNDWELLAFSYLLLCLDRVTVGDEDMPNRRLWHPAPNDGFSIHSMYSITGHMENLEGPVLDVWRSKMSSKSCFLLWLLHFN